jgi:hypothetical protein
VRNHHDDPFGSLIVPPVATDTGGWRDGDLVAYLTIRHADARGTGSGPMGETVDHSLSQLAAEDIRAVVAYLRTVPSIASPDLLAPPTPASYRQDGSTADARGMMLFEGACVSCRDLTGGETDLILRNAHRRMGSQRSQRNKCRPRGAFRHRAVDARACRLDAGVRQRLFRFRDRSSCQLRHRALGSKGVASQRAGRRGVEETNVAIRAMGVSSVAVAQIGPRAHRRSVRASSLWRIALTPSSGDTRYPVTSVHCPGASYERAVKNRSRHRTF